MSTTLNHRMITDQATLDAACKQWRSEGLVAFDTEFIRDETYEAALCLVQVHAGDDVALIDPLEKLSLDPFWALVLDPKIATVVHAGKEDFDLCYRTTGKTPRNTFDVQLAAGFVGEGYPLSLAKLVQQLRRKRIVKGQTLTDWLRRPLTEDQVRYAVDDVLHLPAMHATLRKKLDKLGRMEWAEEEFKRFEDPRFYQPPTEERLFKVKGARKLDGLGLFLLTRLIEWRDNWAREKNRPTRAMVRDDVLVEIARRRPNKASSLQVLRGFPQARNPKIIKELQEIIEQAESAPRGEWPQVFESREETPMMKATLDFLSAVMRAICFEERVSSDLVGGAARLRELLDYCSGQTKERPSLLTGWREVFIGQRLVSLLEGKSELQLSGFPDNPRIKVKTSR